MKYSKEDILLIARKCECRSDLYKIKGAAYRANKLEVIKECYSIIDGYSEKIQKEYNERFEECIKKVKSAKEFTERYPEYKTYYYKNKVKYKHLFIKQRFSTPQLVCKVILEAILGCSCKYNDRSVLKNKRELDIFFRKYMIACEYNSLYWP